ncbi:MAG: DUF2334 domain-containing protein [Candidatus Krumholzibacteriota bacterium]|nr:DUF2334 domain-containing protein [Candidatus Krumholzibacteriota bacterium]
MRIRRRIFIALFVIIAVSGVIIAFTSFEDWKLSRDVRSYVESPSIEPKLRRTMAVRFDPSFYYTGRRPSDLARDLAERWHGAGINLVFFRAYDPAYGAFYQTDYMFNKEGEYGRYDLLKHILEKCGEKGIQVFAWLPVMNHGGAWKANPEWREINSQGEFFSATGLEYPLCARNEEAQKWWRGFIRDLLENYPGLSGVDLSEPVVSWKKGDACYCRFCLEAAAETDKDPAVLRSEPLTELISQSIEEVHSLERDVSLTFVATASRNGGLLSLTEIRRQTGLDLQSILEVPVSSRPDFICPEFIWQEWQSRYKTGESIFTPEWSAASYLEFTEKLSSPVKVIPHIETTDFPEVSVSPAQLSASLRELLLAGAPGFDIYSSSLLDRKNGWDVLNRVSSWFRTRSCLVLYDPGSNMNDAIQTGELLRHFKTRVELKPLDSYRKGMAENYDNVFYTGTDGSSVIPHSLIRDIMNRQSTFCWLGFNTDQIFSEPGISERTGFEFIESVQDSFVSVDYKGLSLEKKDPWTNVIEITDSLKCMVLATAVNRDQSRRVPYAVRSGRRFWFFADVPSAYAVEGGRFLVFADLLHDILNEDHQPSSLAMVRIEDTHPLSDPGRLKEIADFLHGRGVPFQVAFTPYYINPDENLHVSLSERPEFVSALKYMVRRGGALIMHGVTHQRFRETTTDYEFWDPVNDSPVQGQTSGIMYNRLEKGLKECWLNDLYPLAWETPHYAASQKFYSVVSEVFSLAMERRQAIDKSGTDQYLPYAIMPDRYGQILIPENLGYVPLEKQDAAQILERAGKMEVVRDGVASFFFHSFVEPDVLKKIVKELQKRGSVFAGISSLPISVRTSSGVLVSKGDSVVLRPEYALGRETSLYFPGILKSRREINAVPGEKILKEISLTPEEMYALYFFDPVEVKVRSDAAESDHSEDSTLSTLRRVVNFQGEESVVPEVLLLTAATADQEQKNEKLSYEAVFKMAGISVERLGVEEFEEVPEEYDLLIIPHASAQRLTYNGMRHVIELLEEGRISLITSGFSPLSDFLGIEKLQREIQVKKIEDPVYPGVEIVWPEPVSINMFEAPVNAEFIYREEESGMPLVVSASRGKGKYIFSGPLFNTENKGGVSRYPHFLKHLFRTLDKLPLLRGRGLEMYFNPFEREEISVEELVKFWKRSGVKVIHAAAWQVFSEWTYDYTRLIELAHQNSMLVNAWLEPPMVNEKFWQDHPEYHEIDAAGNDAVNNWRHPVALSAPETREAALAEWRDMLDSYSWDGVTVNRLGFEGTFPPEPHTITPFNSAVRSRFEEIEGFDPIELFNRTSRYYWKSNKHAYNLYLEFRRNLSEEYLEDLLQMLEDLRRRRERFFEIILTYDATRTEPGVSLSTVREIQKKHDILWQYIPESPERWTDSPSPFDIIQLEITGSDGGGGFLPDAPTAYPTGSALYQVIEKLADNKHRCTIFSENSLYEVDTQILPFVLGSEGVQIWKNRSLYFESDNGGEILFAGDQIKGLRIDGKIPGSFYRNRLLMPCRKHILDIEPGREGLLAPLRSKARVVDFSGKLVDVNVGWRGISADYEAGRGVYMVLSEKPLEVSLDGEEYEFKLAEAQRGWEIYLPPGRSEVSIITRGYSEFLIDSMSMGLSNLIVIISAAAILILVIILLSVQFRRLIGRHKG